MKPTGIMDYVAPWFIPLFCFLAGWFLNTVIEVKNNPVTGVAVSLLIGGLIQWSR